MSHNAQKMSCKNRRHRKVSAAPLPPDALKHKMTCVTVFMKQVISGNYSYLQLPPPAPFPSPLIPPIPVRTNYSRLGQL